MYTPTWGYTKSLTSASPQSPSLGMHSKVKGHQLQRLSVCIHSVQLRKGMEGGREGGRDDMMLINIVYRVRF